MITMHGKRSQSILQHDQQINQENYKFRGDIYI